jgi:agmatine deiminase
LNHFDVVRAASNRKLEANVIIRDSKTYEVNLSEQPHNMIHNHPRMNLIQQKRISTMFRRATSTVPPIPDPDRRNFIFPAEEEPHEGTWLQWPHNRTTSRRGKESDLIKRYEPAWVQMTKALHSGEKVHLIVYDDVYRDRIDQVLRDAGCDMNQIDFFVHPTDDVWCRDNGPIFVRDQDRDGQLHITDWGFNGWGNKFDFELSDHIPKLLAQDLGMPITTIPMINEGGSIEVDGHGTLMAKRSSILNRNRNKGWTQQDAEAYFSRYLGVTNFIWLDGTPGLDITDDHIDGTARFANGDTIVTFFRDDFEDPREYDLLKQATNVTGQPYKMVHLPLTKRKVVNHDYGYYINYYVGNEVVLVPSFHDPCDEEAKNILQALYGDRQTVMIPMKEVLKDGGMIHCVTQQQPLAPQV